MKEQVREEPGVMAASERSMRQWAIKEELAARAAQQRLAATPVVMPYHYVSISREAGAGGGEVAALVAARLGWDCFDRNLLDDVAKRCNSDRQMLELVDETESNWVFDVLGTWMDRRLVPHEKYIVALVRSIVCAAKCAQAVFVGRGAQFVLPADRTLAVRLVANEAFRLARLARIYGCSPADARQKMIEIDRGRAELVSRFFHHDIADPRLYDLVINTGRLGIEGAADLIVATVRRQG